MVYVNDYYHATDKESDIASTENVIVKQTDTGYLKSLAENGIDCFVVHMPCNLEIGRAHV